jgi:diguanylate cyclase (GGDEF)-like protein/PAS domain S-box-containing protein
MPTTQNISEAQKAEKRLARLNECFLNFSTHPLENIRRLTSLCGELLGADCAFYNRLDKGLLCSWAIWNVPDGYPQTHTPEGHICYDVINAHKDDVVIVRNLDQTKYLHTDPNVAKFKLKTYLGQAVKLADKYVGSLCVVYRNDFIPSEDDKRIMGLIASAVAVEENRRQAQESLIESEERYRTLAESAQDFIFIIGSDWRIQYLNVFGAESIGYKSEEVIGKPFKDIFPHNITSFLQNNLVRVFESAQALSGEGKIEFSDRQLWLHTKLIPLKDTSGKVKAIMGIARDITERKESEEELRLNEAHYRAIVEVQSELICRWIPGGILTFVNDAYCNYFGKQRQELIGRSFMPAIAPQDLEMVKNNFASLTRENPVSTHEHRVILPTGEIRWQKWTNRAIFDQAGRLVEYQSVGQDITERKLAQEALLERERFLNSIFSSIQDGLSILDADLNVIQVNPTMEKWYSHAMPIIGKKCYEAYHGRHTPCVRCPSMQALKTGESAYETVPKVGPNNKIVGWLDLYSFPLLDTLTGKMKGVIEYVRDISQHKKAEKEKETLNQELLQSNRKLRQLALRDPHTGLYNHRYLQEIIEAEFERTRRYAQPLSVMMLDIDYFKSINDVYGHKFGDLVLKQFAKILKRMVRRYDTVIRYGGEEFIVICSGTDRANALGLAKRILDAINLFDFGNKKHSVKLKLSMAIASYSEDKALKGMDLVELADQILSRAKESGGNRVYSSVDIKKEKSPAKVTKNENVRFLHEKIEKLGKRANQSLMEAIFAFAKTIEVKDHYTGEHVERTVKYATEIAKAMNLPERDIELIRQATMLHDLGKIGISEKILLKKGKLTKSEFAQIKKHPQIGVDIIRPIHFLHPIIPILLYHHERWDGKGYPNGLKGADIPVGARIVALADVYQALISDRCYRKAYSKEKAIEIIKEESGKLFDPEIVDVFLRIVHKL